MTRPADQSVIIIGSTKRDDPVYEVGTWGMQLWACDDDMIDFRPTGGRARGEPAGIMQRSCETVIIGGSSLFFCWLGLPQGGRWDVWEQKMKGEGEGGCGVAAGGSR